MICPRCLAEMRVEHEFDGYEPWHCFMCGNYWDDVIQQNRDNPDAVETGRTDSELPGDVPIKNQIVSLIMAGNDTYDMLEMGYSWHTIQWVRKHMKKKNQTEQPKEVI